jgi:hypothetical protein
MLASMSVFWPIDVHSNGYCYGWSLPVLCVAAVVPTDSVPISLIFLLSLRSNLSSKLAEAEKLLRSTNGNVSLLKYCGSVPKIIGRCQFESTAGNGVLCFSRLDDTTVQ